MLVSQGRSVAEAVRTIGVTPFTCYRRRKEFGGLKTDQVKRLKELE
ncbi:transposase, partial [Rhodobaculum claviforme]|nr:transposase [Rhodobaculum claviforme]